MKIKSLTFGLENVELIEFDGKYVGAFHIEDIETSVARLACNSIDEMLTANEIAIEIAKGADGPTSFETSKFKRLKQYDDICTVDFELENECTGEIKKYSYYVHWVDNDMCGENNKLQTTYMSKLGNLYIVISKSHSFAHYFDLNEINDKDSIYFHFDMCDIPYNKEEINETEEIPVDWR